MVLSQSERISQLLDNSRKYVSRNKVRDSSELTLIHQAKASSSTVPAIVQGLANPASSQIVPNYQYANDCPAVTYFTGVGTKDQTALLYNKQKAAICADDDPAVNPYIILPIPKCSNLIPVIKTNYGGSLYFDGTHGTHLEIPYSTDFDIANSENFTIEWFQYALNNGSGSPRLFSIGPFPEVIGMSIEDTYSSLYFWTGVNPQYMNVGPGDGILNQWIHVAIERYGSGSSALTSIFINGVPIGQLYGDYAINNDTDKYNLHIGELQDAVDAVGTYKGYITNFRWTKGVSVYESTDFTVPTAPLTASANTVLLLDVSSPATETQDTSGMAHSVTNNNVVYNARTPF